ncbi:MAG: hypothetical protein JXA37_08030, partial [Chloroflexia bacterium]|nr:hypothetical protein [Chloroflexia bacterium]
AWLAEEEEAAPAAVSAEEEELPAWLAEEKEAAEAAPASPPEEAPPEKAPAPTPAPLFEGIDLPDWLRVEEAAAIEQEPVETPSESLDWLDRFIEEEQVPEVEQQISLTALERMPRPPLAPLSPARQEAADLFSALVAAPEPPAQPKVIKAPSLVERGLHWLSQKWPPALLLLVLLVSWGQSFPRLQLPLHSENLQAFQEIDRAIMEGAGELAGAPSEQAVVLVAYDWEIQRVAEMQPLALALTRHLFKRRARIIAVSTTFQGGQLAQEVLDISQQESGYEGLSYGWDFVNLGIRPGVASALHLLSTDSLDQVFPRDFPFGQPSADYSLVQQAPTLAEVDLLVIMAGEENIAISWLEQVRSYYPEKPCVVIVPSDLAPLMQPYLQARGIAPDAILWGTAAALEYEGWLMRNEGIELDRELPLQQRLNLLAVAELTLVGLILIGNVVQLGQWLKGLGKKSSQR